MSHIIIHNLLPAWVFSKSTQLFVLGRVRSSVLDVALVQFAQPQVLR
jgi:hypothetical protein